METVCGVVKRTGGEDERGKTRVRGGVERGLGTISKRAQSVTPNRASHQPAVVRIFLKVGLFFIVIPGTHFSLYR